MSSVRNAFNELRQLSSSDLGRKLLATTFWSVVGEGVSRGLMLVALILLARILGAEGNGELGFIRTTSTLLASLGGMGLGLTANRFIAKYRLNDQAFSGEIMGSSYVLALTAGTVLGAVLYATAPWIADSLIQQPGVAIGLRVASVMLVMGALSGAQMGILQGLGEYKRLAICGFIQGAVGALILVAAALGFGITGAYAGLLAHGLLGIVLCHLAIRGAVRRQELQFSWRMSRRMGSIVLSFSVPLVLMYVVVAPFRWLSETSLVRAAGLAELGLFHAAMVVVNAIVVIASTLHAPLITAYADSDRSPGVTAGQYINLYGSWYVFLVLALPLVLFPGLTLNAFGQEYASPRFLLSMIVLVTYGGLLLYNQGLGRLITLHGSMWFGLLTNALEGAALVLSVLALVQYGVVGLALAFVISYVVRTAVSIPYLIMSGIAQAALFVDKAFLFSAGVYALALIFALRDLHGLTG